MTTNLAAVAQAMGSDDQSARCQTLTAATGASDGPRCAALGSAVSTLGPIRHVEAESNHGDRDP